MSFARFRWGGVWAGAMVAVAGCATQPTPVPEVTPGPTTAKTEVKPDDTFVLSRTPAPQRAPEPIRINIAEKWWRFRGEYLRLTEAQARTRDDSISEVVAPEGFWDPQTSLEVVSVWSAVCNECHGGRRKVEDAASMPLPPSDWGRTEGLFFGARRRYSEIFNTISRGGPERNGVKSEMPPWRGRLSKELIWALMYFLEYQSGGIEGRFPPSLYPRGDSVGR